MGAMVDAARRKVQRFPPRKMLRMTDPSVVSSAPEGRRLIARGESPWGPRRVHWSFQEPRRGGRIGNDGTALPPLRGSMQWGRGTRPPPGFTPPGALAPGY